MAARIDNGHTQLLTRTGLDWTDKYPSAVAALTNLNVRTAYIDGELYALMSLDCPASPRPRRRPTGSAERSSVMVRELSSRKRR
jgi:hypothetical protein